MSQFLLSVSSDGGATWHDIGLPQLPGQRQSDGMVVPPGGVGEGPGGLTILPDGSLVYTQGGYGNWELLRAHGKAWCRVSTPSKSLQNTPQLTGLTVIGSDIWWLTGTSAEPPSVHEITAASVGCLPVDNIVFRSSSRHRTEEGLFLYRVDHRSGRHSRLSRGVEPSPCRAVPFSGAVRRRRVPGIAWGAFRRA